MNRPLDILRAHGVCAAAEPVAPKEFGKDDVIAALQRIKFRALPHHVDAVFSANGTDDDVVSVRFYADGVHVYAMDNDVVRYKFPLTMKELKHIITSAEKLNRDLPAVLERANTVVRAEAKRVLAVIASVNPRSGVTLKFYEDSLTLAPLY